MARSESRPVSDDVLRAIAHELAEAAPPAPDWDTVVGDTDIEAAPDGPRRPEGWSRPLLLVAAATVLLVVGLWSFRPSDGTVPADRSPDPTTLPTETMPPVGLGTLGGLDAHRCLTRRNARLVLDNRLTALVGRESLPGYTVDRARLAAYRPVAVALAGVVDHPDIESTEADSIRQVVDAYAVADAEAFGGPDGAEGEGFGSSVDAFEAALTDHLAAFEDPPSCSPPSGPVTDDEAWQTGQCVSLWRLWHSVDALARSGEADDDRVVDTSAEALRRWSEPVPEEFTEVSDQVAELLASPAEERDVDRVLVTIETLIPQWSNQFCQPEIGATSPISRVTDPDVQRRP